MGNDALTIQSHAEKFFAGLHIGACRLYEAAPLPQMSLCPPTQHFAEKGLHVCKQRMPCICQVGPKPPDFGAQRRLESRRSDPLLFEVELVRVTNGASDSDTATVTTSNGAAIGSDTAQNQGQSAVGAAGGGGGEGVRPAYRLPAPPSPYKRLLGQPGQ